MIDSRLRIAILRILRVGAPAIALSATSLVGVTGPSAARAETPAPADELSEIIVTGQRAALESAQKFKQNSVEIVDSIVAEDIGKLPDRSVTEVLQRIVGVTIDHTYRDIGGNTDPEHFQVEGAGVAVRGLTYVRSEINGRDSFTANGGRALSFDDVPPELMAAIDVYKNPSAEQIEGAIGGLVNLRTAMPFDFKGLQASGSLGGAWGDLSRGQVKPSISGLISDRWNSPIGEIGALVDVAYSESRNRTDGIEAYPYFPRVSSAEPKTTWIPAGQTVWVPDGFSWRTLRYKRTREGLYGALQWRPSENVESSLTVFRSTYKFHWDENAIFSQANPYNITPAAGFTTSPNGVLTSGVLTDPADVGLPTNDDVRSADRHSTTTDIAWKTRWNVTDRLKLTTDVQLIRASTIADDFTVATGVNIPSETVSLGGGIPKISVDQSYMQNPSNYYWAFTMDGLSRSDGKEWSWREDADFTIGDGFFKSVHAGVRWNDRSAFTDLSEPGNGYNWQAVSQSWMLGWYEPTLAYLNKFPAATSTYAFPNFFNGRVTLPSSVVFPATSLATGWPTTFQAVQAFRTTLCQQHDPTCNYLWTPAAFSPASKGGINTQDERTSAGYFTVQFGGNAGPVPFDGSAGVRIVSTTDRADGYISMPFFNPNTSQTGASFGGFAMPQSAKDSYTDVLPSLNVRFHLTDNLQARLAVAKAIARPDFSQLQAYTTFGTQISNSTPPVQSFTGTANGNPNLKPTKSDQIDATLEWYFAPSGSLTGAVFYKKLTDVIINQVWDVTYDDTAGTPHTFTTTGPINGANGDVKGLEVAYQQYFDFLPNLLKGFGTQVNYTYVDSHRTLKTPVNGTYCSTDGSSANLNRALNGCDTNGQSFGNLPLQNLSKNAFNVALLYDRGPVSSRLAYGWRSKYLMGVNVNPTNGTNGLNTDPSSPNLGQTNVAWGLPLWGDSYGELDGSIFYKINTHITLGFTAQNITDSIYKELQQQHIGLTGFAWYDSGRSYSAQFRVTY